MKDFFKEFLSKDEKRVSALILFGIILTGCAVYMVFKMSDIPNGLKEVIIWTYGFIAGGSAVEVLPNVVSKKEE